MRKFFIASVFSIGILLSSFSFAYADNNQPQAGGNNTQTVVSVKNPLNSKWSSIPVIIAALINILIKIALVLCALWIIWGGFLFVKARGNPEALKEAKNTLLHAVIGTTIILGVNVILDVLQNTINSIKS